MDKQKNYIDEIVKELWDKFKSPLGYSSIDNTFYSMYDLESFLKQKLHEAQKNERKNLRSRLEIILTDPDNYLRGQLEGLIKEL